MSEEHKIQWGNVIAGAAIVAGATLLFPTAVVALGAAIAGASTSIGAWIAGLFTAGAASTLFTREAARLVTGAALLGGGAVHFMGKPTADDKEAAQEYAADMQTFAMQEELRRAEALMQARMVATGYQPAMAAQPAR